MRQIGLGILFLVLCSWLAGTSPLGLHAEKDGKGKKADKAKVESTSGKTTESAWARPKNISGDYQIDTIIDRTTTLLYIYMTIVSVALVYFCIKYRATGDSKGYYFHGTDAKSMALQMVVGLLVFFTVDVHLVYLSSNHLQSKFYEYPEQDPMDNETLRVQVYPQQWAWNFRYAGPDRLFNTKDDIVTFNEMTIPKDRNIFVQMMAKDVIHSFSLPNVRLKQDAIPGTVTRMYFKSDEAGEFPIVCAEMCGLNHYKMKAKLTVLEEADYKKWSSRAQEVSQAGFDDREDALWGWKWEPYASRRDQPQQTKKD